MKLIYVAGPYSAATLEERQLNISAAKHVGKLVARLGYMPVIPHCNTAGFELITPDITGQFWLDGTKELMLRCDGVVLFDGWQQSAGTLIEKDAADKAGIPVFYSLYGLKLWGDNL